MPLVPALLALSLLVPARAQDQAPDPKPKVDCSDPAVKAEDKAAAGCPKETRRPKSKVLTGGQAGKIAQTLGGAPQSADARALGQAFDGGAGGETGGAGLAPTAGAAGQAPAERFSTSFNAAMTATISELPAGQDAINRLQRADGASGIPTAAIVDLGGGDVPAQYSREDAVLELDRKNVADAALAAASPDERKALAARWKTPDKLAADLADRPELMRAVVDSMDDTVVHEYTHAWQARRDRSIDLTVGGYHEPVEWEVEAYREEMRYYHEKVQRDPGVLDRDYNDAEMYRALLTGYGPFRARVVAMYQGQADGSFPSLEAAMERRKNAKGAADAAALNDQYTQRENTFASGELPLIQQQGYATALSHYESEGKPYQALSLLAAAPAEVRAARGQQALDATLDYLKAPPKAPIEDRIDAWQAYGAWLQTTTGEVVTPPDLFALYTRDYRAASDAKLAEAAAAKSRGARSEALEGARDYAEFLSSPDKEKQLARVKAASR